MGVALRKESVDRNAQNPQNKLVSMLSLSARRAWIEMSGFWAYLKGVSSLSARRAWIEICPLVLPYMYKYGRSPQGERG